MTAGDLNERVAICELKARYCRLLYTKEWDTWTELFTKDLLLDTSESGPPPITSRVEAIAMVRATIETARKAHQVHTPEIPIDGDAARGLGDAGPRAFRKRRLARRIRPLHQNICTARRPVADCSEQAHAFARRFHRPDAGMMCLLKYEATGSVAPDYTAMPR